MKRSAILSVLICSMLLAILRVPAFGATEQPIETTCATTISPPSLSAKRAVLYCPGNDSFIFELNATERCGMASTTKIMTALVIIQSLPLSDKITISGDACGVEGSSLYLKEGETLTVKDLLYGLLLRSANDAASALAIACDGSIEGFSDRMNRTAVELGAYDTHFVNPHGLDDPMHYTTAKDLALITKAAMQNEIFRSIVSQKTYTVPSDKEVYRVLKNHNKLLWSYPDTIGVKTGFTKKCGRCLVSAAERDGVELYAVTLDAPSDWRDHRCLFDYGFSRVTNQKLAQAGDLLFRAPLIGGTKESVLLENNEEISAILELNAPSPTLCYEINRPLTAPIRKGEVLGTVYAMDGNRVCASSSLVAKHTVHCIPNKRNILSHLTKLFHH